ncbi:bifunctional diguanylate cyclase/phosphodiesterase [Campylobacter gastrosuis]|uniref:Bifunctional diguanylate cyclase/phosphodiesterase n=1 Tax=Campylobacter gastrosuis TaxID=2974576 RepID=A0ABT7HNI5_9BACT|nr:bifunctional diguanylate cyclase/phosphodiesterase [Campylobacter gastrosuis]MDL0088468.1 bifunctional diguanylate cyclase/phosphodiesterase [Campylobacter gastrosuis]
MVISRRDNKSAYLIISGCVVLFLASIISFLLEFIFLSYLFEAIMLLIVSLVTFRTTYKLKENNEIWILISLAAVFFAVCEFNWYMYRHIFEKKPSEYGFLQINYLIPIATILSSSCLYFIQRVKNDTKERTIILNDYISIFLILGIIFIYIFQDEQIGITCQNDVVAIAGLALSFLTLLFIISAIFLSNTLHISIAALYGFAGGGIFALLNIIFYYDMLTMGQSENRLLSIFFLSAFFLFLFGAYERKKGFTRIKSKKRDISKSIKYILGICILGFIIKNGFDSKLTLFIILISLAHVIVGYYIKNITYQKSLIKKEQSLLQRISKDVAKHTNELMFANLKLKEMIEKDYLTGLLSYDFLMQKLEKIIKNQKMTENVVAYCLNIRHFRLINSSYGQNIGDKILKIVARRINATSNKTHLCTRINADEFIIIARSKHQPSANYENFAQKIINAVQEPIFVQNYKFMLNCIVGIDISHSKGEKDAKTLVLNADKAMFFCKDSPNLSPLIYNNTINTEITHDSAIEVMLSKADISKEFQIFFQPTIEISTQNIVSAEVLLRWQNDEIDIKDSNDFIQIAEKSDIINKLYDFVIDSLANVIDTIKKEHAHIPKISINISPKQSLSTNFIQKLRTLIQAHRINPANIELEMNEKIWTNNVVIIDEIFKAIKDIGVSVCIDDFGTENSSLAYTKKYEINRIKISKSTIANIKTNEKELLIAKTIANISKTMQITSVAKGVKDDETMKIVKELKYDQAQGNFLLKAMSSSDFIDFLKQNKSRIKNGGGDGSFFKFIR